MIAAAAADWLASYHVAPQSGFLPLVPPLEKLGPDFEDWEKVAAHLPEHIANQSLDQEILRLPHFPVGELADLREQERAMLLLSFLSHAWLRHNGQERDSLPPVLAQAWVAVAESLGRPPVLAHPSLVLHNWRKKDPQGPLTIDNLDTLLTFHGSPDEKGFVLSTAAMEIQAIAAWPMIASLRIAVEQQQVSEGVRLLQSLVKIIEGLTQTFGQMRARCRPAVFFAELRPYLASMKDIRYEGVTPELRSYDGGSAAQSAIFQTLDAALGVVPERESTRSFLVRMRRYMIPAHARLIEALEAEALIPAFCQQDPGLKAARNLCLAAMTRFRTEHLKIVAAYIIGPAGGTAVVGTGGTSPVPFLKSVRKATQEAQKD